VPSSGQRPSEILKSRPKLKTDDYEFTETDHEKNSQKKMEKSDTKEELGIDSEKSKVEFI
jgi:hypothetical protein